MYLNPILRYGKVAGGGLFIGGGVLVCKSYGEINKVNSKIEVSSYFATPPIPPPPTPRIRILKIDQKKAGVFGQGFGLIQNLNQKKTTDHLFTRPSKFLFFGGCGVSAQYLKLPFQC